MKEIKIEDIINKLNEINLIDIRDSNYYRIGNIPNSINIPMNYLIINPSNYLNKNSTYYIYCNYGISSKKTCEILSSEGYDVVNIIGGFQEYKNKFYN